MSTQIQQGKKQPFHIDINDKACKRLKQRANDAKIRKCKNGLFISVVIENKYSSEVEWHKHKFAEMVAKEFGNFVVLKGKDGKEGREPDIYYYEDGIYKPDGKREIEKIVNDLIGIKTSPYHRDNVLREIVFHIPQYEHAKFEEDKKYICCKNGVLNLETLKLTKHTPKKHFLTKIPVNWNPKADCPKFKQFLKEVLIGRKKRDKLVQEMIGLSLYRGVISSNPAFFILKGGGRNGKSTLLEAIKKLIGDENYLTASLSSILGDKATEASLYGKLANLAAECNGKRTGETEIIKLITSGDTLTARNLYSPPFKFQPYATLIFAFNDMPIFKDTTTAMLSRIHLIEFPKSFNPTDKKTDANMINKITTKDELEGIFVYAIEGLQRILHKGYFTRIEDNFTIAEIMQEDVNSVKTWAEDNLEFSQEDEGLSKNKAYKIYLQWCKDNNIMPENKMSFSNNLMRLNRRHSDDYNNPCSQIESKRVRNKNGKREYVFLNVRIKEGEN